VLLEGQDTAEESPRSAGTGAMRKRGGAADRTSSMYKKFSVYDMLRCGALYGLERGAAEIDVVG